MPTLRSGPATIEWDDKAFVALLDRVTDGAASHFLSTTRSHLEPIRAITLIATAYTICWCDLGSLSLGVKPCCARSGFLPPPV